MARGFRGSAGPSTRSRQEEGVAGVQSGVERRVHERSVPPSVGGHVGSPVASPQSRARLTVGKSVDDKEVIVLDQSPHQKTFEAALKPPPDAFALLRDMLQGLGKKGGKGVVAGEKSGASIESVASTGKGAVENRGAPNPSGGIAGKGVGEKWGAPCQVVIAAGLLSKTKPDSVAQLGIVGHPVEPVGATLRTFGVSQVCAVDFQELKEEFILKNQSLGFKNQVISKLSKRFRDPSWLGTVWHCSTSLYLGSWEATESSDVEKASTVIVARHEKSKKPKVIGYAPPPLPDDQVKTRGGKSPF
ncbi:unnamed protein product [Closterium sp. NIES-53]